MHRLPVVTVRAQGVRWAVWQGEGVVSEEAEGEQRTPAHPDGGLKRDDIYAIFILGGGWTVLRGDMIKE